MESGAIGDNSLTSPPDTTFGDTTIHARLNKEVTAFPYGWLAPSNQQGFFLQIDLGSVHKVKLHSFLDISDSVVWGCDFREGEGFWRSRKEFGICRLIE